MRSTTPRTTILASVLTASLLTPGCFVHWESRDDGWVDAPDTPESPSDPGYGGGTSDPGHDLGCGGRLDPTLDRELDALCLPDAPTAGSVVVGRTETTRTDAEGCTQACTVEQRRTTVAVTSREVFGRETSAAFPGNVILAKPFVAVGQLESLDARLAPQRLWVGDAAGLREVPLDVQTPGEQHSLALVEQALASRSLRNPDQARVRVAPAKDLAAASAQLGFDLAWLEQASPSAAASLGRAGNRRRWLAVIEVPYARVRADRPWTSGAALCGGTSLERIRAQTHGTDGLGFIQSVELGQKLVIAFDAESDTATLQAVVQATVDAARVGQTSSARALLDADARALWFEGTLRPAQGPFGELLASTLGRRQPVRFEALSPLRVEVVALTTGDPLSTALSRVEAGAEACAEPVCPLVKESLEFVTALGPHLWHVSGTREYSATRCDTPAPLTVHFVNDGAPWCELTLRDGPDEFARTGRVVAGRGADLRLSVAPARTLSFRLGHANQAPSDLDEYAELTVPCGVLEVVARCR